MMGRVNDKTKRIIFFSKTDLSCAFYLTEIENILTKFYSPVNLADVLELYHVKKFIDSGVFKHSWEKNTDDFYREKVEKIPKIVGLFFSQHQADIPFMYIDIEIPQYCITFWNIFLVYKLHERWDESIIINIFKHSNLRDLLQFKKLTENFGSYFKNRIMRDSGAADLIISKYVFTENKYNPIYFPHELTKNDISTILLNYIQSPNPSLTNLEGIMLLESSLLTNPKKIKYYARKRCNEIEVDFFSKEQNYVSYGIQVEYNKNQEQTLIVKNDKRVDTYSYDLSWILDNTDYQTLLNNFIYLFQFVDDRQFRCSIINNRDLLGVIERTAYPYFKKSYNPGSNFHYRFGLARLQLGSYYNLLKDLVGIRLEDIISFFFEEYLSNEFGIYNYKISMPSESSTFLEKCKAIAPEIDKVLKEYDCLVTEGHIVHDLINISSDSKSIGEIPSIFQNKYFIGSGEDFQIACYFLCSDQCMLNYLKRYKDKHYYRFYKLVIENEVFIDDYNNNYKKDLNWLKEHEFIIISDNGRIQLTKRSTIIVELFRNKVINFLHYPASYRQVILDLEEENFIVRNNSFFSKPEQDFFNYVLNNSSFVDSLAIRNKYVHGTYGGEDANDKIHENNYYLFLILIVILVIKINDECCIKYYEKSTVGKSFSKEE